MTVTQTTATLIAEQNDQVRQSVQMPIFGHPKVPHKIVYTQGIAELSPEDQICIFAAVRNYDDFTPDNDPYGGRDFGTFTHNGHEIIWKIDYYDTALKWGSEDPADLSKTVRILTILLASEY